MIGTYIFHNPETEEVYVGSGIISKRYGTHVRNLTRGTHPNHKFQEAYNRNPNFEFTAVAAHDTAEARDIEQGIITENWGNPLLLNISSTVLTGNEQRNQEIKQKISTVLKEKYRNGEIKPSQAFFNPEVQAKAAASRIGNKHALGSTHSEEWKQNASNRMKNNKNLLNHVHSEETRSKMSESHKGRTMSPEAVAKSAEGRTKNRTIIDGVEYANSTAAAKTIGLSRGGVIKRCLSDKFPNYQLKVKG